MGGYDQAADELGHPGGARTALFRVHCPGLCAWADAAWLATEAWYTAYGKGPQILTGAVTESIETMREILASEDWRGLRGRLQEFVSGYEQKVVEDHSRFQL
jgi:hypothetical protein